MPKWKKAIWISALGVASVAIVLVGSWLFLGRAGLLGPSAGTPATTAATTWSGESPYQQPALHPAEYMLGWGFIDNTGQLVIPATFWDATDFQEGLAPVRASGGWGYIDSRGEMVIKPQFAEVSGFSEGLAAVKQGESWGYIDYSGNYVIPSQFAYAGDFKEGVAPVHRYDTDDVGYIDRSAHFVLKPRYYQAGGFNSGLAAVYDGDISGYIDHSGDYAIRSKFHMAGDFSDGYALASTLSWTSGERYGVIDARGKYVAEPQFDNGWEFSEGLGAVEKDGLWGYVDNTATWVIQPQFGWAFGFHNGLAQVRLGSAGGGSGDGEPAYIDRTGKIVWRHSDAVRANPSTVSPSTSGLESKSSDQSGEVPDAVPLDPEAELPLVSVTRQQFADLFHSGDAIPDEVMANRGFWMLINGGVIVEIFEPYGA